MLTAAAGGGGVGGGGSGSGGGGVFFAAVHSWSSLRRGSNGTVSGTVTFEYQPAFELIRRICRALSGGGDIT